MLVTGIYQSKVGAYKLNLSLFGFEIWPLKIADLAVKIDSRFEISFSINFISRRRTDLRSRFDLSFAHHLLTGSR